MIEYLTKLGSRLGAVRRSGKDRERGASLVEYALLLALIAVVCVVAVASLGTTLDESYSSTDASLFAP
jgi:Flp pilus assembly pilin Flp